MSFKATNHQKSNIKRLLNLAEFDSRTVTIMHRRLGASDDWIGKAVDEWLDTLDLAAASRLIDKLKPLADEEDEDE